MEQPERVQKVLARAGHGSRREIESWIRDGRLTINGRPAVLGASITGKDKVELDGKRLRLKSGRRKTRVIALHKPAGYVCSRRSEDGKPSVFSLVPALEQSRWISVGRLDVNTSGLLLFTNDGELAHRLMHPKYRIDREYAVRVFGDIDDAALERLRHGVEIDGQRYALDDVVEGEGGGANRWFYCVVRQGRNREVRKLWESQGVQVSRLVRVRFGNVILPRELRAGKFFDVEGVQLQDLYRLVAYRPNAAIRA